MEPETLTLQEKPRTVGAPWEQQGAVIHPVTRSVLAVANQLFAKIDAGEYSFGMRLPAERHLADEFQVSRSTVRQVLDLMSAHKVISRRAGSGSFVIYRSANALRPLSGLGGEAAFNIDLSDIAEVTSPLELNVVRSIIEPEMVRLAVINMSAREIERLRDILMELDQVTTSAEDFSRWDIEFHLQLARGTRNALLIGIYKMITHVRQHAQWARNKEKTLSPKRIQDYKNKHSSIYEAIEARDIESAVEFINLHMVEVQRDLMRDA